MDGSNNPFVPVVTIDEVIETAMLQVVPFSTLRQRVQRWMKERRYFLVQCDRDVNSEVGLIYITHYAYSTEKETTETVRHIFDEFASYTAKWPEKAS